MNVGQKAPSAKRCIKTSGQEGHLELAHQPVSESTERQKLH